MRATSQKTFRELMTGLGALVAAVVVQAVIVWAILGHLQRIDRADDQARSELLHFSVMIEAVADQAVGLKGYRIAHDDRSLATYQVGRQRFEAGIAKLRRLTADDPPAMRARVQDAISQVAIWNRDVAGPQIAAIQAGREVPADATLGQVFGDAVRNDFGYLRDQEMRLLEARDHDWRDSFDEGRVAVLCGSAVALLFAVLIACRSFRRVMAQQVAARRASDRIARALERANASERAKTTFLANMSHEMLTPLNGVLGMAAALGMTGLDERQQGMLGVIHNSAADLEGLIGNLLTLSRAGGAECRRTTDWAFHLGEEVRVVAEEYAAAARIKGLRFAIDVPSEADVRVRGDAARLERVLNCLLSNAVKFTERGEIRIGVTRLAGDSYRFDVSDTGIGFDEAEKATLFSTFTQSDDSSTRRFGGAGVGLAVASKVVHELGGRLDGRSKPGEGSHFTFEVELAEADPGPATARETALAA